MSHDAEFSIFHVSLFSSHPLSPNSQELALCFAAEKLSESLIKVCRIFP